MEKFKLIKSYPGSPEEGTVVSPTNHDKDIFTDGGKFRIHREWLEKYGNFWETKESIISGELRIKTTKGVKILTSKTVSTSDNNFTLKFPGFDMSFELDPNETDFKFCE